MTIAVVVPAYNESGYVGAVIDGLPSFVDRAYVVDDGSTDDTWAEITTHASARNDEHDGRFQDLVVPIQHDENRGVGGAIKTGYLRAREEGIDATAVLGGDDQMDPEDLQSYLDPIADGVAEYTKGNRLARPELWESMPRLRFVGNVALSYLTKVASGYWGSMDSQNGYTAISRSALERTDIEGMYEYYGYCNNLLVRLNVADVQIADVARSSEYAYTEGWKSHIDYREYVPRVSVMLARSFLWRLQQKYLITDYHPLAPLYLLGSTVAGLGLLGTLASLLQRESDGTATWVLTTAVGTLTFVYASMLDREDNDGMTVQVDPNDSEPETDEHAPEQLASTSSGRGQGSPHNGSPADRNTNSGPAGVEEPPSTDVVPGRER